MNGTRCVNVYRRAQAITGHCRHAANQFIRFSCTAQRSLREQGAFVKRLSRLFSERRCGVCLLNSLTTEHGRVGLVAYLVAWHPRYNAVLFCQLLSSRVFLFLSGIFCNVFLLRHRDVTAVLQRDATSAAATGSATPCATKRSRVCLLSAAVHGWNSLPEHVADLQPLWLSSDPDCLTV